jgi:hypothetical protein
MIKKLFEIVDHHYPLMRDPQHQPKCYELTDQEREEASRRVDQLLRERDLERTHGYFGA